VTRGIGWVWKFLKTRQRLSRNATKSGHDRVTGNSGSCITWLTAHILGRSNRLSRFALCLSCVATDTLFVENDEFMTLLINCKDLDRSFDILSVLGCWEVAYDFETGMADPMKSSFHDARVYPRPVRCRSWHAEDLFKTHYTSSLLHIATFFKSSINEKNAVRYKDANRRLCDIDHVALTGAIYT
jgi:hypothetical protein